jgi:heterodisulfide reductase subunit C
MWATIVLKVVEILAKLGFKKKQENDAAHRKALEKTIESGNESREVEKEIRDEHKEVDKNPSDVETPDGGLNFDDWNAGN